MGIWMKTENPGERCHVGGVFETILIASALAMLGSALAMLGAISIVSLITDAPNNVPIWCGGLVVLVGLATTAMGFKLVARLERKNDERAKANRKAE